MSNRFESLQTCSLLLIEEDKILFESLPDELLYLILDYHTEEIVNSFTDDSKVLKYFYSINPRIFTDQFWNIKLRRIIPIIINKIYKPKDINDIINKKVTNKVIKRFSII